MPGKGPTIAASKTLPPDSSTADKSRRGDGVAKVDTTRPKKIVKSISNKIKYKSQEFAKFAKFGFQQVIK